MQCTQVLNTNSDVQSKCQQYKQVSSAQTSSLHLMKDAQPHCHVSTQLVQGPAQDMSDGQHTNKQVNTSRLSQLGRTSVLLHNKLLRVLYQ